MRFNDAVIGALLLVLGMAIFFYARTLPPIPGQEYGAAVFPMLVALGLAGCGVALVASGVRTWEGALALADWTRSPKSWFRLAATIALLLAYILWSDRLGFIPSSVLMLFVMFTMLGSRPWVAALIAVAVTIVIAKLFSNALLVPLPRGLFWI